MPPLRPPASVFLIVSAVSCPGVKMPTADTATNATRVSSTLEVSSSRGRARSHRARAEPGRSRAPAAPRAPGFRFLARSSASAEFRISTRRTRTCGSGPCLEGFRREALTRALERRSVVQATLMRGTNSRRLEARLLGVRGGDQGRPARVVAARAEAAAGRARARADRARATSADGGVGRVAARSSQALSGRAGACWGLGSSSYGCRPREHGTSVVRTTYQTAERWIGPEDIDREAALDHVVRRYLAAFGPAPRTDIASWAGLDIGDLVPSLERLSLRRFVDERGKELLDLPRAPLPDPSTPARCVFSRPGTRRCSSTHAEPRSCPSATGRSSSRRRILRPSRRFSSTAPLRGVEIRRRADPDRPVRATRFRHEARAARRGRAARGVPRMTRRQRSGARPRTPTRTNLQSGRAPPRRAPPSARPAAGRRGCPMVSGAPGRALRRESARSGRRRRERALARTPLRECPAGAPGIPGSQRSRAP